MNKNEKKASSLWRLFTTFFKIGTFSFGGGYGMISFIEREVVAKNHWVTEEEMLEMLAIAESTPGPISVNTATFVGVKLKGIMGGIIATLGTILPSFLIIFAISMFFDKFMENVYIEYAFRGIRIAVVVLILNATIKFYKKSKKTIMSLLIMVGVFLMSVLTQISTILLLVISAIIAIFVKSFIAKDPPQDKDLFDIEVNDDNLY